MINARSETIVEKPAFRDLWERRRRCLVPANGFYEWKGEGKAKKAYFISDPNSEVIAFAGLWSKKSDILTFTILTKEATGDVAGLHQRTPVIIRPDRANAWFSAGMDEASQMIAEAKSDYLRFHEVGPAVGKVANDDDSLPKAASGSFL